MARSNWVCHLLNGGVFWTKLVQLEPSSSSASLSHMPGSSKNKLLKSIYEQLSEHPLQFKDPIYWRSSSKDALALLKILNFDANLLGRGHDADEQDPSILTYGGPPAGTLKHLYLTGTYLVCSQDLSLVFLHSLYHSQTLFL